MSKAAKTPRPFSCAKAAAGAASAAIACTVLAAPAVQAASVTLGNGDRLTGTIVALKDQTLTFKSPLLGEVKIPWAQVSELKSDEGVRVQLADGQQLSGTLAVQPDGKVVVAPAGGQPASQLNRGDVALLNPPVVDNSRKYSGHATLGGTFNRGNSHDDALNVEGELIGRAPADRYTLNGEAHEAKSAGIRTTSNSLLSGQYDKFLTPKDYLFGNLKLQNDEQADLRLRSTLGTGYGRQFSETDNLKLSAEAGVSYIKEDYKIAPDKSFPALSLNLNYEQKFFGNALVLFNKTNVSVSLEKTSDTLVKNKLGFRVPIAHGLNLSTQLNLSYDQSPPMGVKRTDTSLVVGVGYSF